ncbi:MAG TPA: hypothetical protein VF009_02295 [Solirubrobacterales bacterium]
MGKTEIAELVGLVFVVGAVLLFLYLSGGEEEAPAAPSDSRPVLVCVDSTLSTDGVREKYESDLEKVVRRSAMRQDTLYAAACGANATGEVDWPIQKTFRKNYSDERFGREELEQQAAEVIEGNGSEEGVVDLLDSRSHEGTPIGEMLAVTARQCAQARGSCEIYVFTDGEWADSLLRIRGGISDTERRNYLREYDRKKLAGLGGSTVNFIGVGLGTEIGELRLDEARELAKELVEQAGGTMGSWSTRL